MSESSSQYIFCGLHACQELEFARLRLLHRLGFATADGCINAIAFSRALKRSNGRQCRQGTASVRALTMYGPNGAVRGCFRGRDGLPARVISHRRHHEMKEPDGRS